jgi:hypothetical protein
LNFDNFDGDSYCMRSPRVRAETLRQRATRTTITSLSPTPPADHLGNLDDGRWGEPAIGGTRASV